MTEDDIEPLITSASEMPIAQLPGAFPPNSLIGEVNQDVEPLDASTFDIPFAQLPGTFPPNASIEKANEDVESLNASTSDIPSTQLPGAFPPNFMLQPLVIIPGLSKQANFKIDWVSDKRLKLVATDLPLCKHIQHMYFWIDNVCTYCSILYSLPPNHIVTGMCLRNVHHGGMYILSGC